MKADVRVWGNSKIGWKIAPRELHDLDLTLGNATIRYKDKWIFVKQEKSTGLWYAHPSQEEPEPKNY